MNTININSDDLSKAIQNIIGVVERKQTMPILRHILIEGKDGSLIFTSTDLEVQLSTEIKLNTKTTVHMYIIINLSLIQLQTFWRIT